MVIIPWNNFIPHKKIYFFNLKCLSYCRFFFFLLLLLLPSDFASWLCIAFLMYFWKAQNESHHDTKIQTLLFKRLGLVRLFFLMLNITIKSNCFLF